MGRPTFLVTLSCVLSGVGACVNAAPGLGPNPDPEPELQCDLDERWFASGGVPRDGIPALSDPELVTTQSDRIAYLADDDRVIGMFMDGRPVAVPHNILWHHEIANLDGDVDRFAVSYCPLTGSALVFDRASVGGAEFGVSGLLYQANLIMYDRNTDESLWPQMLGQARCGPRSGNDLPRIPEFEMTWEGWQRLYPQTLVVGQPLEFEDRDYRRIGYPYGNYEQPSNQEFLGFPVPNPDRRRNQKERVFGIPGSAGGVVLPFGELDELDPFAVVSLTIDGQDVVVFWDREKRAAAAFHPELEGERLTFQGTSSGFQDQETATVWNVTGEAVIGAESGRRLEPVGGSFVAFWGAWMNFNPESELWLAP